MLEVFRKKTLKSREGPISRIIHPRLWFKEPLNIKSESPVSLEVIDKFAKIHNLDIHQKKVLEKFIRFFENDFRAHLIDIFSKITKKCDIQLENTNLRFISNLKIYFTTDQSSLGVFYPNNNFIALNLKHFVEQLKADTEYLDLIKNEQPEHYNEYLNFNLSNLFFTLIHEISHTQGYNKNTHFLKGLFLFYFAPWKDLLRSGVSASNKFHSPNEAITLILEKIIYTEINKRTGLNLHRYYSLDDMSRRKYDISEKEINKYGLYDKYVYILLKIIEKISEENLVDKDTIFRGFINAYFTGKGFPDKELKKQIIQLFGREFYNTWKKLNPNKKNAWTKTDLFILKYFPNYKNDAEKLFDEISSFLDLS